MFSIMIGYMINDLYKHICTGKRLALPKTEEVVYSTLKTVEIESIGNNLYYGNKTIPIYLHNIWEKIITINYKHNSR